MRVFRRKKGNVSSFAVQIASLVSVFNWGKVLIKLITISLLEGGCDLNSLKHAKISYKCYIFHVFRFIPVQGSKLSIFFLS